MIDKRKFFISSAALIVGLSLQIQQSASADDTGLQAETALMGTAPAQAAPVDGSQPALNGSVRKVGTTLPDANDKNAPDSAHLNGDAGSAVLNGENADDGRLKPFNLAVQKLRANGEMTSDDYRDLDIGILGYSADRTYFQNKEKVTAVYPGCPADLAGMKVGDIIIDAEVDDSGVKDPTRQSWVFSCGKAGVPKDITVWRHGKSEVLHLVSMNIEDMPDLKIRREYERYVKETGAPAVNAPVHPPITAGSVAGSIFRHLIGF